MVNKWKMEIFFKMNLPTFLVLKAEIFGGNHNPIRDGLVMGGVLLQILKHIGPK